MSRLQNGDHFVSASICPIQNIYWFVIKRQLGQKEQEKARPNWNKLKETKYILKGVHEGWNENFLIWRCFIK